MSKGLDVHQLLSALPSSRLVELGKVCDIAVPVAAPEEQAWAVLRAAALNSKLLLNLLTRDELQQACLQGELPHQGRTRDALTSELATHLVWPKAPLLVESADEIHGQEEAPAPGQVVVVRRRTFLVEEVVPGPTPAPGKTSCTRVSLLGIDDDNQDQKLDVFWEMELGAKITASGAVSAQRITSLEDAASFSAKLNVLRWQAISSADASLLQSPYRAGIDVKPYQLCPLKRALDLPRANLFIADDVGLGKTVEAGLIIHELVLRQQVDFIVIACPPSVCLQWQDEMYRKFGLAFTRYNRGFADQCRQTYGFGVAVWGTRSFFIVSHHTLAGDRHQQGLLQLLAERKSSKTLLVLDEAHAAAPAAADAELSDDSDITTTIRKIAPLFTHRLFLSATPHNGHSSSFSSLLAILDPQRFSRGMQITQTSSVETVVLRRLKSDIKALGLAAGFPQRKTIEVNLEHHDGRWSARCSNRSTIDLGESAAAELELAGLLEDYSAAIKPLMGAAHHRQMSLLQKRLLSSVAAFCRTLEQHRRWLQGKPPMGAKPASPATRAQEHEHEEESGEVADDDGKGNQIADDSDRMAKTLTPEQSKRLDRLHRAANKFRSEPDARVRAVWHAVDKKLKPNGVWGTRRLIVFTESVDTLSYLRTALANRLTDGESAERIAVYQGGMSDKNRAWVTDAFNNPESPLRILLATDAAREGINLHACCADLIHFDVPWNPARMEQRNGRIDRQGQRSEHARCYYFNYPQRQPADQILTTLRRKVATISAELGPLTKVVLDQISGAFSRGLGEDTAAALDNIEARARDSMRGLALSHSKGDKLRQEIEAASILASRASDHLNMSPAALKKAVDLGLMRSGLPPLRQASGPAASLGLWEIDAKRLPKPRVLNARSWTGVLNVLRRPVPDDAESTRPELQPFLPLNFGETEMLGESSIRLHLSHPLVQRALAPLSMGQTGNAGIGELTAVRTHKVSAPAVVAVARLRIFGVEVPRLHDELVYVAASVPELARRNTLAGPLLALDGEGQARLTEIVTHLDGANRLAGPEAEFVLAQAPHLRAALWPFLTAQGHLREKRVRQQLAERGQAEAGALERLLTQQVDFLSRHIAAPQATGHKHSEEEENYRRRHLEHLREQRKSLADQQRHEPDKIRKIYTPRLPHIEWVGLACLLPLEPTL